MRAKHFYGAVRRRRLSTLGRRTARLDGVVHHLGLALGGRPGASLAKRLMLPVSNDTLLRVVRRRGCPMRMRSRRVVEPEAMSGRKSYFWSLHSKHFSESRDRSLLFSAERPWIEILRDQLHPRPPCEDPE